MVVRQQNATTNHKASLVLPQSSHAARLWLPSRGWVSRHKSSMVKGQGQPFITHQRATSTVQALACGVHRAQSAPAAAQAQPTCLGTSHGQPTTKPTFHHSPARNQHSAGFGLWCAQGSVCSSSSTSTAHMPQHKPWPTYINHRHRLPFRLACAASRSVHTRHPRPPHDSHTTTSGTPGHHATSISQGWRRAQPVAFLHGLHHPQDAA